MNNKVVQTIIEMLHDRHYKIQDNDDEISAIKNNKVLKVFFLQNPKIGIKNINNIFEKLQENNINNAIIVHTGNISSFAKQLLDDNGKDYSIEIFHEDELVFNITHHHLVPKHEIISNEIKQELKERYKISDKQFPYIYDNDPVCKYYNGKPGDLFRITRNDSSIYYRLCVKKS